MLRKSIFSLALAFLMIASMIPMTALADGEPSINDRNYVDTGPAPRTIHLDSITRENTNFRKTMWTGDELQVVVMSIPAGGDVGLEVHDDEDQFVYIVSGRGVVKMGDSKEYLDYSMNIEPGSGIFVPKGKWHNIINTGSQPLKLFAVYAPPHHPQGTTHRTEDIAEKAEKH